MSGNKSVVSSERKALLRALFEGHGYCLEQLELISGVTKAQLGIWCVKEEWTAGLCILLPADAGLDDNLERQINLQEEKDLLVVSMARASRYLWQNLDEQTSADGTHISQTKTEGRLKEIVSISKAIQILEGLIANMETPKDEASQYPQDTLEFHRILTKQIENLTNPGAAD